MYVSCHARSRDPPCPPSRTTDTHSSAHTRMHTRTGTQAHAHTPLCLVMGSPCSWLLHAPTSGLQNKGPMLEILEKGRIGKPHAVHQVKRAGSCRRGTHLVQQYNQSSGPLPLPFSLPVSFLPYLFLALLPCSFCVSLYVSLSLSSPTFSLPFCLPPIPLSLPISRVPYNPSVDTGFTSIQIHREMPQALVILYTKDFLLQFP